MPFLKNDGFRTEKREWSSVRVIRGIRKPGARYFQRHLKKKKTSGKIHEYVMVITVNDILVTDCCTPHVQAVVRNACINV